MDGRPLGEALGPLGPGLDGPLEEVRRIDDDQAVEPRSPVGVSDTGDGDLRDLVDAPADAGLLPDSGAGALLEGFVLVRGCPRQFGAVLGDDVDAPSSGFRTATWVSRNAPVFRGATTRDRSGGSVTLVWFTVSDP
ncbi:MAG: hypothetical protein V5A18_06995 [Haloarculaceae archaeon]